VNFLRHHCQYYARTGMMSRTEESSSTAQNSRQKSLSSSIFSVPAPIKQLFDQFPLLTYPINDLPQRAPRHRNSHVLYVFTTDAGAIQSAPSYNPACLKWQVGVLLLPALHYSSSQHYRHTSSSPKSPSGSPQQTTMPHPVAPYRSYFPRRQSRISNHNPFIQANCNDGP
jgi:metaxin